MNEVLLKAEGIYKSFGATKAVVDFHIEVCRGTIHGLIGENGSGKSTFSSIVAGIQQRDSGRLLLRGRGLCTRLLQVDAAKQGVCSHCSGNWHDRFNPSFRRMCFLMNKWCFVEHGCVDRKSKLNAEAKKILSQIGGEQPYRPAGYNGHTEPGRSKLVEIARGMYSEPEL